MKSFTTIRTRSAIALVALITVLPVCVASAEPATAPGLDPRESGCRFHRRKPRRMRPGIDARDRVAG